MVHAVSTNDVWSCSTAKSTYSPLSICCCSWVGAGTGSCWEVFCIVAVAVVATVEATFAGATAVEVVLVAAVAVTATMAVVSEAVPAAVAVSVAAPVVVAAVAVPAAVAASLVGLAVVVPVEHGDAVGLEAEPWAV